MQAGQEKLLWMYQKMVEIMRTVSWISLGMVAMYLLNTYVLFLHDE
jgi:hypothetical protein